MTEIGKVAQEAAEELEKGLHLHHHLGPRRERAMFAALGFTITLAVTRGITTLLHDRGAGPNGGIKRTRRRGAGSASPPSTTGFARR